VIAAVSRAGAVLLAGESVALVFLAWRRGLISGPSLRRRLAWTAVFSVTLVAVVGWQVTIEKFREPEPYRVRGELLRSSLAMLAERPLAGFGLGTWPIVYPAYARFDNGFTANHAHNDWAEWAAEGGVPFVALMGLLAMEHSAGGGFAVGHRRAGCSFAQPGGLSAAGAGGRGGVFRDDGGAGGARDEGVGRTRLASGEACLAPTMIGLIQIAGMDRRERLSYYARS